MRKSDIADPPLADAAFNLSDGAISAPVKTRFGAALVRVTKIEPAQVKPFVEESATLKNEIARDRAKKQVGTLHDKIEDARASGKSLADAATAVACRHACSTAWTPPDATATERLRRGSCRDRRS